MGVYIMEKRSSGSLEYPQVLTQLQVCQLQYKAAELSDQGSTLQVVGSLINTLGSVICSMDNSINPEDKAKSDGSSSIQSYSGYLDTVETSKVIESYKILISQVLEQLQIQDKNQEYCIRHEMVQSIRELVLQLELHMEYLEGQLDEVLSILGCMRGLYFVKK